MRIETVAITVQVRGAISPMHIVCVAIEVLHLLQKLYTLISYQPVGRYYQYTKTTPEAHVTRGEVRVSIQSGIKGAGTG